jgi:predicted TIM-barrel fold metal-dependent hydrolase
MHPGPPGAAYIGFPKIRPALGDPLLLEDVLVRHPRLRLYVMHAGWPFLENMIALLNAYPQVYVDVGVIDWTKPRRSSTATCAASWRRVRPADHVGSDQMVWPEAIDMAVAAIQSADYLTRSRRATSSSTTRRGSSGWSRKDRSRPRGLETLPR